MCQDVKVSAGAMVVSSLLTKAGALFVLAAGSSAALYVLAQGGTALVWVVLGVTTWAATATIGWIAAVANPRRKVAVPPHPAVPQRHPAIVVEARPALEAGRRDPAAYRTVHEVSKES